MRLLLALLTVIAFSGCIQEPTTPAADVFVLEYRIVDLGRDAGERTADPGHHCGDASRKGDTLTIWLWPEEERPEGPWLAVFPQLPDDWRAGIGAAPFKTTFPATVDPDVQDDPTTLGSIAWESLGENGTMRIDGEAVSLPHSWQVTGEDGRWRAEATLSAWAGHLKVDRYTGLCD